MKWLWYIFTKLCKYAIVTAVKPYPIGKEHICECFCALYASRECVLDEWFEEQKMSLEEERISELANYKYKITEEDEKAILSKFEKELIIINRSLPELTWLESIAYLFAFTHANYPLVMKRININSYDALVTFYETGETVVEPYSDEQMNQTIAGKEAVNGKALDNSIQNIVTFNKKVQELKEEYGVIYPKQRIKLKILNNAIDLAKRNIFSDSNQKGLEEFIILGMGILKKIKLPIYVNENISTNLAGNITKIEIQKTKNQIYQIAKELGKKEEADFIINSIVNRHIERIKLNIQNGTILSLGCGKFTSFQMILIDMHYYYLKLFEVYKKLKEKESEIEEIAEISQLKLGELVIDTTIIELLDYAEKLNKKEEALIEVQKYRTLSLSTDDNITSMQRLFNYYTKLKVEFENNQDQKQLIKDLTEIGKSNQ